LEFCAVLGGCLIVHSLSLRDLVILVVKVGVVAIARPIARRRMMRPIARRRMMRPIARGRMMRAGVRVGRCILRRVLISFRRKCLFCRIVEVGLLDLPIPSAGAIFTSSRPRPLLGPFGLVLASRLGGLGGLAAFG
jgi:hypothetical protein